MSRDAYPASRFLPGGGGALETEPDGAKARPKQQRGEPRRYLPHVQPVGTVKAARDPAPQDVLEHRDGSPRGIDEEGIVVEGEIDDAVPPVPVLDLVDDADGVARAEPAVQQGRGAVGAPEGTAA